MVGLDDRAKLSLGKVLQVAFLPSAVRSATS